MAKFSTCIAKALRRSSFCQGAELLAVLARTDFPLLGELQVSLVALSMCALSFSLSLSRFSFGDNFVCFCCLLFGASVWELQQVATHFLRLSSVVVAAAAAAAANTANKTSEKQPTHTHTDTGTLRDTNTHNHAQQYT